MCVLAPAQQLQHIRTSRRLHTDRQAHSYCWGFIAALTHSLIQFLFDQLQTAEMLESIDSIVCVHTCM